MKLNLGTSSKTAAAAADSLSTAGKDFQDRGALKRHSLPDSFSGLRVRTSHASRGPPSLLDSHTSEMPGPSYPFPSQHQPARQQSGFQGLLNSLLKPYKRARAQMDDYTFLDWLQLFLPCVRWLRNYRIKEFLLWDLIAGISVGFMVVPQGMSYANIAGVPSVFGLYGAFLPVLVYAVFGSSRELAVGPVAVTSLLISSSLKDVVPGSSEITNPNNPPAELASVQTLYNHRAIQLSLLVACMYTAVGVFNLGFLTNFLSHSVIGGFTSGAAIIIGLSQLKYILGFNVPRADKLHEQIELYIHGMDGFVWQEYVMGVTLLTLLLTIKYFGKRYPRLKWLRPLGPITACIIGIIAVVAGNLQNKGIRIVGHIPAGLPAPTVSWWMPLEDAASLAPLALVVMLVDLLESTSIARALAAKGKYDLKANQEIVGLGLANFAGSAFNAYSTTGSFSRSAVNYDSGCKTGLSGFVTGCVVGLVLLVMTPVFEKLPLNVMGAIVISGVSGLFEYEEAVHLFKVRKLDWCVWMCSFLSTMFLGVEIGLAISIGLALMIVIYESAFPHTALLGRVGRTTIYRNVKQFPDSQVIPGIAACRVDAPMYFANVQYIHERLRKYVARAEAYSEAAGLPLQYLLLDMSPVTHLDSTGASLLQKLYQELQDQGVQLGLCNPACTVIDLLERTGFPDELGREWIFVRMHDAIQTCLAAMISDGQAVRPLSAYDSQALSPRRVAEALDMSDRRRSGTGGAGGNHLMTRSMENTSSLLLPSKLAGAAGAGPSPRYWPAVAANISPRIAAAEISPYSFTRTAASMARFGRGYSSDAGWSSTGGFDRPGSAPGFRSAGGASSSGGAAPEKETATAATAYAGSRLRHSMDRRSPFLAQQQQHVVEILGAGAAPQEAAGTGQPHQPGAAAEAGAATTTAATGVMTDHMQHGRTSTGGAAVAAAAGPAALASGQTWSVDGSSMGGSSYWVLPPPVNLAGLNLHISPNVLNHPAVLSRACSEAGHSLSKSASLRRSISPRTERLLDEVFSANDGADMASNTVPPAFLQLGDLSPGAGDWQQAGAVEQAAALATEEGPATGAAAGADAPNHGDLGCSSSTVVHTQANRSAAAAAGSSPQSQAGVAAEPAPVGEVRLLFGSHAK